MNAAVSPVELAGLTVSLDRLVYHRLPPEKSSGRPHAFIYFLSIQNDSDVTSASNRKAGRPSTAR